MASQKQPNHRIKGGFPQTDRNNLHLVKNELTNLDRLCQQFQDAYDRHLYELTLPEDKERAALHFNSKESEIFEYRKQVVDWIRICEKRLSDQLDRLSDKHSGSQQTHVSRKSHKSRSSIPSSSSAWAQKRAKVVVLLAKKSMLKKKLELEVAEKQLELELMIAKAQAKERAFTKIEEEERIKKTLNDDKTEFLNLPEPKSSSNAKRALPSLAATTMGGRPHVKTESETRHVASPLNPASEFYLAFPGEIKTETKTEDSDKAPSQTDEEEILKEVFKFQHEQIQQMITSQ